MNSYLTAVARLITGIKPASPVSPALADSLPLSHLGSPIPMEALGGGRWGMN